MTWRLLRWVPVLIWMGIIFYWSSQPVLPIDRLPGSLLLHYLSHLGAYGILAVLLALGTGTSRRGLWLAFALAALYGIADEIHQSFTPGRGATARDVLVDAVAAGVALLLLANVLSRRETAISRRV